MSHAQLSVRHALSSYRIRPICTRIDCPKRSNMPPQDYPICPTTAQDGGEVGDAYAAAAARRPRTPSRPRSLQRPALTATHTIAPHTCTMSAPMRIHNTHAHTSPPDSATPHPTSPTSIPPSPPTSIPPPPRFPSPHLALMLLAQRTAQMGSQARAAPRARGGARGSPARRPSSYERKKMCPPTPHHAGRQRVSGRSGVFTGLTLKTQCRPVCGGGAHSTYGARDGVACKVTKMWW